MCGSEDGVKVEMEIETKDLPVDCMLLEIHLFQSYLVVVQ